MIKKTLKNDAEGGFYSFLSNKNKLTLQFYNEKIKKMQLFVFEVIFEDN